MGLDRFFGASVWPALPGWMHAPRFAHDLLSRIGLYSDALAANALASVVLLAPSLVLVLLVKRRDHALILAASALATAVTVSLFRQLRQQTAWLAGELMLELSLVTWGGSTAVLGLIALRLGPRASQVARAASLLVGVCATFLLGGSVVLGGSALDEGTRAAPDPDAPNILLISIDSLRADHLGSYGYHRDTSPNIDRIASQGVVFERMTAVSSWTLPTHISMLSGLPMEFHGVSDNGRRAEAAMILLPEVLRQAGYQTAGFVAGPYLDSRYGFWQGFDHYDDYSVVRPSHPGSHVGVTSPKSIDATRRWLSSTQPDRPWFVFLHLWDVHYDYTPPPPYDTMYTTRSTKGHRRHPRLRRLIASGSVARGPRAAHRPVRRRDHLLRRMARRALRAPLRPGRARRHDHSHHLGSRRGVPGPRRPRAHPDPLRRGVVGTVHRPLSPKVPAGQRIATPVRQIDLPTTLLSLADVTPPVAFAQGHRPSSARDLSRLWRGEDLGELPATAMLVQKGMSAIRKGDWKAIHQQDWQLFDLAGDPAESVDLSTERGDDLAELQAAHERFVKSWLGDGDVSTTTEVDPSVTERLRAQGYVE